MNGMNYKPYINRLLTSLDAEELKELQDLVNVQKKDTIYRDLNSITDADKGVGLYTILLDIRLIATGYLIYNDQYCTLLGFSNTSGRVIIYELNLGEKTYRVVNEYLTVDYLRHEIDILNLAVSGGGLTEAEIQEAIADGSIITSNIVHLETDYMPNIDEQHLDIEITDEQYNSIRNNPNTVIELYDDNYPRTLYFYRVSDKFETISLDDGDDLYSINPTIRNNTKYIELSWHSIRGVIEFRKTVTNNTFTITANEFSTAVSNENVLLVLLINNNYYTLNKSALENNGGVIFSSDKYIAKFNSDGVNYTGSVEEVASGTKLYYHKLYVWQNENLNNSAFISFISASETPISNINYLIDISQKINYLFDDSYYGQSAGKDRIIKTSYQGSYLQIWYESLEINNDNVPVMYYYSKNIYSIESDTVTEL